ncbi:hypothetical protein EAG_04522 [Camponotus floridanus]|uniref:Uncharacterized protein n=1 Tax=Camponotus floridanus TaxID=104421 RepID=E2AAH5_CAMFO|nr:uncharacterized protein LOC105250200 [Camponotus floridanus]EFN69576.1 hypothetical protein EAG_04522 [Camponotus floridanus]
MVTMYKLQYLLIIGICLQLRFSYGRRFPYELPYNEVKIVTHGEPCYPSNYLPVTIEEPVLKPVSEDYTLPATTQPCTYQPLKLNYQVIADKPPIPYQSQANYPVSIQIPEVPEVHEVPVESSEIVKLDPYRGKSYTYNTQSLPSPSVPISTSYNFDLYVPPSPSSTSDASEIPTQSQSVKLLTGLTSRIDRVLIPACESPTKCACQVS